MFPCTYTPCLNPHMPEPQQVVANYVANSIKKVIALFTATIAGASWIAFVATGHPVALLSAVAFTFATIVLLSPNQPHYHRRIPPPAPYYPPPRHQRVEVIHEVREVPTPIYVAPPAPPVYYHQPTYHPQPQPWQRAAPQATVRVEEFHDASLVSGHGATARAVVGGANRRHHNNQAHVDPEHKLVSGHGATARAVVGGAKR